MATIMGNDGTVIETVRFLHDRFPDIFRNKFLNGDYVYKNATSRNVNALLSANPKSLKIRIAILDSILQNNESGITLESDFFKPLSGSDNSEMRYHFFSMRPDFIDIEYNQLPQRNRVDWILLMSDLLKMYPKDKHIRMVYFKLCANSNSPFLPKESKYENDDELIEMIQYVRTLPMREYPTRTVRDLYNTTACTLRGLRLPSGETPFTQAIIDRRTDIIDIIMSRDKEEVKQFLIARNSSRKTALQVAFEADIPEQYRASASNIPYDVVAAPDQFVIYKKLLSLIPRYCNPAGKNSLGDIVDMYFQNTYGNKTMMRLLLSELRKNRAYQSDFRSTISDILSALGLPMGSF